MTKSFSERLHRVIPGGAHTYSRGDDQHPSNAPQILERGKGAYVWDPGGNKYLDYGMALRAVTIGYANERVNQGAYRQMEQGVNLTRASRIELEAAELVVSLIPGAEMVKFAKNGSNVTTAAAKVARAYTGRKYIGVARQHPFFSFDDWFIGVTPVTRGIPAEHASTTLLFDYGDVKSVQKLFDDYPDQIAGIMMEPATSVFPCPVECATAKNCERTCATCPNRHRSFLHQARDIAHRNGALFILDEMITGFRWHVQGAQRYFDIEADLSTFGKAMANGFSVAALVGRRELMSVGGIQSAGSARTFLLSTTHGAEMPGLGAFVETVKIYREEGVVRHLWDYGRKLFEGINRLSAEFGLRESFYMEGSFISMNYVTKDAQGYPSLPYRTLFMQEMVKHGVLIPWVSVSLSHSESELALTLEAVERSLRTYRMALREGIDNYLVGNSVKPVFRQHN